MERVHVPATLANLGSGFDALGVALALYLEAEAAPAETDRFHYSGEGFVPDTPDNLVHQAFRAAFARSGRAAPTVEVRVFNPIPLARGLGSSAAARVAGAALADRWLDGALGPEGVFAVASELEGHPDNVAPAVFGGFQLALTEPLQHVALAHPEGLRFVVAVPGSPLSTEKARGVLPRQVPHADARYNLARAALWSAALAAGRLELLAEAARDRLHQPYRLELMPGAAEALAAAEAAGALAAFVAGAGPSLAALVNGTGGEVARALADYAGPEGRLLTLEVGGGCTWKAT
ncbi:MAG TPA: homoserine kinase [Oceanithermus profundus]|uniref:Homoserine kinase n=1 Tax=Oceanithermus profundus TaxID=187137 RepID=A0A7C4Z4Z0_9DEIN|nr:homoserine kinase [Oceanithermus profundus]